MLELTKLATRLLKGHKSLYLSCAVTISIVAILSSAQITLGLNLGNPNLVHIPRVSADELKMQLISINGLLITLGVILLILSGFLIFISVVQVVQLRNEEIELLRLAGASKTQLASLISIEVFILSLFSGVPAALVGGFFSIPLSVLLKRIGFFNENMHILFAYNFMQVLIVSIIVIVISIFSAFFATLKVAAGKGVSKQIKHLSLFSVSWRLAVAVCLLVFFLTKHLKDYGEFFILLMPLIVVAICLLLSPLVLPLISKAAGFLIRGINPGVSLLVSKQGRKLSFRLSHYAAPTIICIGIAGTFMVSDFPESELIHEEFRDSTNASFIIKADTVSEVDKVCNILTQQGSLCSRFASRAIPVSDTLEPLYFSDVQSSFKLLNQKLVAGDISKVQGLSVASSDSAFKLGQKIRVYSLEHKRLDLTVVALIDNSIYEGIFIDWAMHSTFGVKTNTVAAVYVNEPTVFVDKTNESEVKSIVNSINPSIKILSRDGYAKALQDRRLANSFRGNIGLFGTIYIMVIVALLQLIISEEISRRNSIQRLHFLGVDNPDIVLLGICTVVTTQLVALFLVLSILVIVAFRYSLMIGTSAMPAFANAIPFVMVSWVTILIFTMIAYSLATLYSMKVVRKNV